MRLHEGLPGVADDLRRKADDLDRASGPTAPVVAAAIPPAAAGSRARKGG
jgi:hypothetical protein